MEAKELRIGNWVTGFLGDKQIKHFVKDIVNFEGFDNHECNHIDVLHPIPLTEDWLLKFGFDKKDIVHSDKTISTDCFVLGNIVLDKGFHKDSKYYMFCLFPIGEPKKNHQYVNSIKHVHSLQNLYYALTSEELTINK